MNVRIENNPVKIRIGGVPAPIPPAPEPTPETPHTWTMKCNGLDGEIGTYTVPQDPPTVSQN